MKKYIVKGTNLKALLEKVASHFKVDITKIKYEILRKTPELEVKVWTEKDESILLKDSFNIEIREDGIFLIVKETDESRNLTLKRVLRELEEREIKDFILEEVESALYKPNTPIKIAEYDKEYYIDSFPIIEVLNNLEATIRVTKPHRGRETTPDIILKHCEEKGIIFGIRKKTINTILHEKIYDRKIILAKGKEVSHGKDASINYVFKKETTKSQHQIDVESVNFKDLDWFVNVSTDEILVIKEPSQLGEDGIDIFGKVIMAKEPKDIILTAGKNTYVTDDGMYLKSSIDGQLVQKGKVISVEPLLIIPGNVDYATGNVDFLGTVIVKGNVLSGFSIHSGEDIFVEGLVEDAELVAQGKIVVNNGILGNEEFVHTISAKEGIKALFIQHMKIKTEGTVDVSKHILHSYIEAGDKVICTSGVGKIIGGEIKSQKGIECNIAGGPFETPTKLILDIFGDTVKEESEINKEMLVLEENKFKIKKLLDDIEPIKDMLQDDMKEKVEDALVQQEAINNRYNTLNHRRDEIENQRQAVKSKTVNILHKVYPGVIIKIAREIYLNRVEKIKTDFYIDRDRNELVER